MQAPARPTFALPHLGGPKDDESVERKRQYRLELQEQLRENQKRKDDLIQGRSPQRLLAQQFVGFGDPGNNPKVSSSLAGSDLMMVLHRWEQLFATQAMQSADLISSLNKRITELESVQIIHTKDAQALRERVDRIDDVQGQDHRARISVEQSLKDVDRLRERDFQAISKTVDELRTSTAFTITKITTALDAADQRIAENNERLQEHTAHIRALHTRFQSLEQAVSSSQEVSRASHEGLEVLAQRLASSDTRLDRLERITIPETRSHLEKAQHALWSSASEELSSARRAFADLQSRVSLAESSMNEARRQLQSRMGRAVKEAADGAAGEAAARAAAEARVSLPAHIDGLAARAGGEEVRRLRSEVSSLFDEIAGTVRDADGRHGRLLESVRRDLAGQLEALAERSAAAERTLERQRAALEDLIASRADEQLQAVEALKERWESGLMEAAAGVEALRLEVRERVESALAHAQSAERSVADSISASEAARRRAEEIAKELSRGAEEVRKAQVEAEDSSRAAMASEKAEGRQLVDDLRRHLDGSLKDVFDRILDVDNTIKSDLRSLHSRCGNVEEKLVSWATTQDSVKSRLDSELANLRADCTTATEAATSVGRTVSENLREMRSELSQRCRSLEAENIARLDRNSESLRSEMSRISDTLVELHDRIGGFDQALSLQSKQTEGRIQEVQSILTAADSQILQVVETKASMNSSESERFQAELIGVRHLHATLKDWVQKLNDELESTRNSMDKSLASVSESEQRHFELISADVRYLKDDHDVHRRETNAKFLGLDTKLVEDIRKILNAIQLHKDALESLRCSVSARFANLIKEEETHVEQIWADLGSIRESIKKDKLTTSEDLARLQKLLQQTSRDLQVAIDRESSTRIEACSLLNNEISMEAKERQAGLDKIVLAMKNSEDERNREQLELEGKFDSNLKSIQSSIEKAGNERESGFKVLHDDIAAQIKARKDAESTFRSELNAMNIKFAEEHVQAGLKFQEFQQEVRKNLDTSQSRQTDSEREIKAQLLASLAQEVNDRKQDIERLQKALDDAYRNTQKQQADSEKEIKAHLLASLAQEIDERKQEIERLQKALEAAEERLTAADARISGGGEELEKATKIWLETLEKETAERQAALKAVEMSLSESQANSKEQSIELKSLIEESLRPLKEDNERISAICNQNSESANAKEWMKDIEELSSQIRAEHEGRVENFDRLVTEQKLQESSIKEHGDRIKKLEEVEQSSLAERKENDTKIENQFKELKENGSKFENQFKELKESLDLQRTSLEGKADTDVMKQEITRLESQTSSKDAALDGEIKEIRELMSGGPSREDWEKTLVRVDTLEKGTAKASLELEQGSSLRKGDLQRVTVVEDQLRGVVKKVDALMKGKGVKAAAGGEEDSSQGDDERIKPLEDGIKAGKEAAEALTSRVEKLEEQVAILKELQELAQAEGMDKDEGGATDANGGSGGSGGAGGGEA